MEDLAATNGHSQATSPEAYPGFTPPEWHTLPSGARFLLRRPNLLKMMRRGEIPNPLMEIVNRVFEERDERDLAAEAEAKGLSVDELLAQKAEDDLEKQQLEPPPPPQPDHLPDGVELQAAFGFMDVVCWAAILDPRVELEPQANPESPLTESGALSFDAISQEDNRYIMEFVNRETAAAERFPADSERETARSDSGEVRSEAEHAVGHPA